MGEIKSVKVDNWGVFFLQKLQNFFNKTDYCDMTLQFNDNSQLKVHRLVLSACTDYFNLLESNCELIDDALVMPNDLQADVVVPIVNFMYTGTLEFELNMYNKLLRTARDMNMTVLLKLLEAHRRTMEQSSVLSKPQVTATQVRSGAGRTYPAMLSPTKPTTMQRGSIPTHAQGARNASNISRRPVATQQRGNIVIKEETSFDPSPFEQLRQSGINYKRPASKTYETPPEKKPSIEDVKEFAEQQRMRKQIAAEVSGIPAEDEYVESYMEDEFTQDDEDEDNTGAQITIKQEPNQKPTIVFKASADNKMDHAKIIGEVLKKYPHLIKNNKNLKLKIMPNSGPSQQQKLVVKKEEETQQNKPIVQQQIISRPTQVQATATETAPKPSGPPKKIDSKTMHALIALGAENTTGPWLCLRCGVNGRPISIPSYRGFRRHLINTHREKIDPRLCEHCGYRSSDVRDLHFHVQVDHQITSTAFTFPRCEYCAQCFITNAILNKHIEESHTKNQQCIYCNEVYPKENDLYNHMKIAHKKQAQNDGVIDFSDGEDGDENEFLKFNTEDKKIKILSDISLPTTSVTINEGTKFVTADGSEMVLSDEQRDQLMAQLDPNQDTGGIIMVLNESFQLPDQQHVVESVVGEQVQEQNQQEEQQQVQEKQDEENMFVYKEMDADDENMDEEERQEEHQEDESGNIEAEEKEDEPEKMQADEELDEEEIEQEHQSEVNASEDAKKLDEKLKMITGEWTDDEAEEERTDEQISEKIDKTASEPIKKEEVIEKSEEAPSAEQQQEEPLETEAEEKNKDDQVEENAELDSPLKQELMEFLGIENMDEPVDEKVSEDEKGQQDAQSAEDEEHEKDIQEQVKQEMIEQAMKLADEKSTAEVEMEDELTQLREEIESNAPVKEENVDHAEEQAQRKPVSEEISDSELQQQLESEDEKPQDVADSTEAQVESSKPASDQEVKDDGDGNKDANDEEVTSQAPAEEEPAKDALKSIITDWADEGDAQDDDL